MMNAETAEMRGQSPGIPGESSCRRRGDGRKSSNIAREGPKVGIGKQSKWYSRAIEALDLVATDARTEVLRTSLLFSAPLYPDLPAGGEDLTQRRRDSQKAAEVLMTLRFSARPP